jgi:demethylmenaquinone methyltransferase/2-methoxy-6-polyprenyl-1,4-benzoquinol methylase
MTSPPADPLLWDEAHLGDPHAQADKAARVRAMFDAIAPTYERVNRLLSAGRDAFWRRKAVRLAAAGPADLVLDVACGTGDFARAFSLATRRAVTGCDFSQGMLDLAAGRPARALRWCRSDALALPFADGAFTVVSCAFGVRNFQDLAAGLREMARVLAPGGRMVILEFSLPRSRLLGGLYLFYFRRLLPRLAAWISGDVSGAYRYLPRSVSSFPDADGIARALRAAGLDRVEVSPLTIGIVTVFVAWKTP